MATYFRSLLLNADGMTGNRPDNRIATLALVAGVEIHSNLAADQLDEFFHLRLHLAHLVRACSE